MPTPTPWPTPTSLSSMREAGQYANASTNYLWGAGMLVVYWLVLFMAFGQQTFPRRVAAASWLTMITSFFFQALGLVSWTVTSFFVAIAGLSALVLLVFTN